MISLAGLDDVEEIQAVGPSLRGTREDAGFTVDKDQDCGKRHIEGEHTPRRANAAVDRVVVESIASM